jgi:hypothetical protein
MLRWLRFCLAAILVLVVLGAVWLGITARRASQERQAMIVVRNAYGLLHCVHELAGPVGYPVRENCFDNSRPTPGPEWLRFRLGNDFFKRIVAIDLTRGRIGDADLARFAGLKDLQSLNLDLTDVTDAGLAHLKPLPNLTQLYLDGDFTDAGVEHLKRLASLQYLQLVSDQVGDKGVQDLKKTLPRLVVTRE